MRPEFQFEQGENAADAEGCVGSAILLCILVHLAAYLLPPLPEPVGGRLVLNLAALTAASPDEPSTGKLQPSLASGLD